jgi:two-component system NtrC family sensor kinase
LTGGVAHDFNNILMVVQSSVALARQLEARGQPVAKALSPIERAVANGAQLTRQLLAVVRRQPLQVRTVDLGEVVPALAQLMSSTLGRSAQITHEVEPGLRVTADQAELELALINLCINAKDAMPDGGVIHIAARGVEPPVGAPPSTPWVRITVTDSGEGIAPELLGRITEPFFTTKPLGKGTGLGLSQVQSFVSQAGGRLEFASEFRRGTQVSILLPCTVAEPEQASQSQAPVPLGKLNAAVLLVEDNPDIAEAVSAILQDAGAHVTWHKSADTASRAVADGSPFDVVLSDVSLPGEKSGIDLAREIASAAPHIPVVLMTGYTDRLHEATAAGFRVVPKPATPESLLNTLIQSVHSVRKKQP